jgi:hypothetical protein
MNQSSEFCRHSPLCCFSASVYCCCYFVITQSGKFGYSLVKWATGWTIGVLGFDSWRGLGVLLFTTESRTALGPSQPPIQWVSWALSLVVKRPGREADHSPPSSAEVKECVELYLHSPNAPPWRGAQLKHRDNFTFTLPRKMFRVMKSVVLIFYTPIRKLSVHCHKYEHPV